MAGSEGERMQPWSKAQGKPSEEDSRWRRPRWWPPALLGFVLSLAGLPQPGCQRQVPTSTPPVVQRLTPQSKLEWVAKRLQRAFELGKPPRLAGIRVEHTMSYQFKEPSDSSGPCQATVVIVTRTENTLLPKRAQDRKARQGADPETKSAAGVKDRTPAFQESHGNDGKATPDNPPQKSSSGMPKVAVVQQQQSFELVYRDDRWQLAQAVNSDPERLWFQYALQE